MQIRTMTEDDLKQVAAMEQKIFSQPWSMDSLKSAMLREDNIYLAVVRSSTEEVIGYCGLWGIMGEGAIYNVAVSPDYRNRGVGEAMLTELLDRGRKAGLKDFTLEVRKSNEYAIRLYQKLGFCSEGIRKNFYEFPTEDAVVMWLREKQDKK